MSFTAIKLRIKYNSAAYIYVYIGVVVISPRPGLQFPGTDVYSLRYPYSHIYDIPARQPINIIFIDV